MCDTGSYGNRLKPWTSSRSLYKSQRTEWHAAALSVCHWAKAQTVHSNTLAMKEHKCQPWQRKSQHEKVRPPPQTKLFIKAAQIASCTQQWINYFAQTTIKQPSVPPFMKINYPASVTNTQGICFIHFTNIYLGLVTKKGSTSSDCSLLGKRG